MRKTLLLAWREYQLAVKTKAFVIMIVLAPIMMGGGIVVAKLSEDHVDTTDRRIAVVDHSGVVADALVRAAAIRNDNEVNDPETGKKVRPAYHIEVVDPEEDTDEQRLALSDRVRERGLAAFVEVGASVLHPGGDPESSMIRYYAERSALDDARRWIQFPINEHLRNLRLEAAGVAPSVRQGLLDWRGVEALGLVSVDAAGNIQDAERSDEGRAIGVPLVMLMLMFMMIMVAIAPLVNAVLEEKMQRIAEVMLGSVRPFELMMGKLLGTLATSFTVLAIYLAGGISAVYYLGVEDYVPFEILPWFLVYTTAAIFIFGSLLIALAAACNDIKEAQSVMMPIWMLVVVPMMVWLPVVKEPLSGFATSMSLIPPFTPSLMLIRQATPGGIPAWQPWVGLAGVTLCTILSVWTAGRIFRIGILMQGTPPKLSRILRWAIRG